MIDKPYGLTTLQYTTLSVLGHRGELSKRAARAPRVHDAPVEGEVIDALEKQGLIARNRTRTTGACSRPR